MKILTLRKNIMSIQKCLLPDCEFMRNNYGCYCRIAIPGTTSGILVKIGLCEPKQITGAFFVDDSVLIFSDSNRAKRTIEMKDLELQNFQLLHPVSEALQVNVTLVFDDVSNLVKRKLQSHTLRQIVKEILKLYTFSQNSVVFLDNLSQKQRNDIYCIDINCVDKGSMKNVYKCREKTEIIVNECVSKNKYEMSYCPKREIKLGGLNHVYGKLKESIELSKKPIEFTKSFKFSNKILLIGPPGCGKTSVIKNVVRDCKTVLLQVLLTEICSSLPGETERNLENVFNAAKVHSEINENCVILIEDIDVLCVKRTDGAAINLKRTVNKLISLLDEFDNVNRVVVIATTTNVEDVDPLLRRAKRFDDELEIMMPSETDREEIIHNILSYFKVSCPKESISNFALWTPGFVGSDLHMALQETILSYRKIKGDEVQDFCLFEDCFKKALSNTTATCLKGSVGLKVIKDTDFSKIGGLHDVKKLLDFSVKQQLLNPEMFSRMGIPLSKGILLYGPPGCAKTTLVKALAKESNMTFLSVSSADLYSPYVGDAEKTILKLFSQARTGAPAIIFIDEIDGLIGSKSGDRERGVQERVLSTLLVEMDGIEIVGTTRESSLETNSTSNDDASRNAVIVIGATNRPERLDDALKRPGRFDKIIYVPPPDANERLHILKKLTEEMPLRKVDLQHIANETNYYSGADLKNLCYESALLALTDSNMAADTVDMSHFLTAMKKTRPSLNPEMIRSYESFRRNISR